MKVFHWTMQIRHGGWSDIVMSMGYGGTAKILLQDENVVVYEYLPYNLNDSDYRNADRICDGLITISKLALVEPEIHVKMKRMPSGRKQFKEKRIRCEVDYDSLLHNGEICIENSKYCWQFVGGENNIGMIAMRIVFQIFDEYQDKEILPELVSINW